MSALLSVWACDVTDYETHGCCFNTGFFTDKEEEPEFENELK